MKKVMGFLGALIMTCTLLPFSAMAYIERGTVQISCDAEELTLGVGETYELAVTIDPAQEDQMPGCGMSDCPQKCGSNCLSKDNNCTCDSTSYDTYYADLKIKDKNEGIADAVYEDGKVIITALSEGETELKLSARLREYLGTSVVVAVKVVAKGEEPEDPVTKRVETEDVVSETEEYTAPDAAGGQSSCCQRAGENIKVSGIEVTTENHGEEDQQVHMDLTFCCKADSIEALDPADFAGTLAGEDIDVNNISVEMKEDVVRVNLKVMAVKAGVLEMTYQGDKVAPFAIHAIVSPGMNLEVVEQDPENASVTMRVSELFHIRGIGRVMLMENGEVIPTDDEDKNVFTGIHGHNFMELDGSAIAEKIVFGLNETHPTGYSFSCKDDTVTVKKENADGPVELLLKVQSKAEVELL